MNTMIWSPFQPTVLQIGAIASRRCCLNIAWRDWEYCYSPRMGGGEGTVRVKCLSWEHSPVTPTRTPKSHVPITPYPTPVIASQKLYKNLITWYCSALAAYVVLIENLSLVTGCHTSVLHQDNASLFFSRYVFKDFKGSGLMNLVHTLVGIPFTTKVYSVLANIAKAERMKHVAIARHALKIMKKKQNL